MVLRIILNGKYIENHIEDPLPNSIPLKKNGILSGSVETDFSVTVSIAPDLENAKNSSMQLKFLI